MSNLALALARGPFVPSLKSSIIGDYCSASKDDYPKCNILNFKDKTYRIELAVPGWSKEDIEISFENGLLSVIGTWKSSSEEEGFYIHKGLSYKNFRKEFSLATSIKVVEAKMERGFLCINLENIEPLPKKPKQIVIK